MFPSAEDGALWVTMDFIWLFCNGIFGADFAKIVLMLQSVRIVIHSE
jgi:hypothetical protein